MITLRQYEEELTSSSDDYLAPIAAKILNVRSEFIAHLERLPEYFIEPIKTHYFERLVRAEDRHMLGEYIPFLLADVLQIPAELAERIAIPWLTLYEQALLVDDLVDSNRTDWVQEFLSSQILFTESLSLWQGHFSKSADLWRAFCTYHSEAVLAALQQTKKAATLEKHSNDSHLVSGRKAALVKFCGAALSLEHKGRLLSSTEELGIDYLCTGIQLLDDLTDHAEDYHQWGNTFPLQEALRRIRRFEVTVVRHLRDEEIIPLLILSGAVPQVVELASEYLMEGLLRLAVPATTPTYRYIASLVENSCEGAGGLKQLLNDHHDEVLIMARSFCEGRESWGQLLTTTAYSQLWVSMQSQFARIAKASN